MNKGLDVSETIVAVASAAGVGARSIVRLSGARSLSVLAPMCPEVRSLDEGQRRRYSIALQVPGINASIPAEAYIWPPPRTYTGQLMVELHVPACAPLVDALVAELIRCGARAAEPGEFTMRAFLAGKIDLTKAEAIHAVVASGSREELRHALGQLAGGVADPLRSLRSDLLDLLADMEAALDFGDEDIEFVGEDEVLHRLGNAMAVVTTVRQQLDRRALSERAFRVVLAGRPNAGKSSLFNALGRGSALVSPIPGTTRDYLVQRIDVEGIPIELIDTAGWNHGNGNAERQAQSLAAEQLEMADLVLYCIEGDATEEAAPQLPDELPRLVIATKSDVSPPLPGRLATSAKTGEGLDELRQTLRKYAREHARPALAPSLSRCRGHIEQCLESLRRAHHLVLQREDVELLSMEIRTALDQLGEIVGAVYTEDLLDRIFSRFCIGK